MEVNCLCEPANASQHDGEQNQRFSRAFFEAPPGKFSH
jgi:hypothetical protein